MKSVFIILLAFWAAYPAASASKKAATRQAVGTRIERRTGHGLNPVSSAEERKRPAFPPGIVLREELPEDDAVAIALWNNSVLERELARLGLAEADLREAGLIRNPSLNMLFPSGAKPFELVATVPIEELWQRGRRLKAAQANLDVLAEALVQTQNTATITLTASIRRSTFVSNG